MSFQAFKPDQDQVRQVAISNASQRFKICSGTPGQLTQVRLVNNGTQPVNIKAGDDTVEAETTDMTVVAGVTEVLTFPIPEGGQLYLAVIGSGATGTFEATGGQGI